jgi:hypothetical protein
VDWVEEPFQREHPDRPATVAAASTRHQSHNVGGHDLPALAGSAEPGRLDHRIPEIVVVLATNLAAAEAHSETNRVIVSPVVLLDALLHRHRTPEGGGGRTENHHQPVSKILDLGPTSLGKGLAKDRNVSSADVVSNVGWQVLGQLRRAHDVRKQDRRALRRH